MNNVDRMLAASASAADFARQYAAYLSSLLAELDVVRLEELAQVLETARAEDHTVFLIGNGGSAATASHWASDLMLGTAATGRKLRALSLADSMPALTALANDRDYADVFLGQLEGLFRRGDVLIAVSASGNSPNVVRAVEWVNREGGITVGVLGFDGGRLKSLCRIPIVIATPAGEYGPVEDIHMVIDHLVTAWLKRRFGTRT